MHGGLRRRADSQCNGGMHPRSLNDDHLRVFSMGGACRRSHGAVERDDRARGAERPDSLSSATNSADLWQSRASTWPRSQSFC